MQLHGLPSGDGSQRDIPPPTVQRFQWTSGSMNAELPLDDAKPVDADKMRMLLRRKFPADQYAMLYEVRDAAGFGASRSADIMMVGLWPSRGCQLEGMELKISRGDWLRELKKPEKAEAFVPYCDRWWVIASTSDIVKLDELPPTWGLMVPRGNGMGVIRQAPDLSPKPVDRSLLAAMLKRATDTAANSPEVRAAIDLKLKEALGQVDQKVKWATQSLERENKDLKAAIAAFEEASGVQISSYRGERVGAAVKAVLGGEHRSRLRELANIKRQAASLHEWLAENIPDEQPSSAEASPE